MPTAATTARSMATRSRASGGRGRSPPWAEVAATPAIASAKPASCQPLGRSPVASPTTTGSAAPVAAIGMTMLIVPMLSAR